MMVVPRAAVTKPHIQVCWLLGFWIIAGILPVAHVFLNQELDGSGEMKVEYPLVPVQFVSSYIIMMGMTISTNAYARRVITRYGNANSALAETLRLCQRALTTAA